MSDTNMADPASFEAGLKELEGIVKKLETGEAPLEEAIHLFERGIHLSRYCSKKLEEAEKKIELLVKDPRGEYKATPFTKDDQS